MSRLILCGAVSWLVLASFAPCRADDAEDKVALFLEKLNGVVTRDENLPGKPVVEVILIGTGVGMVGRIQNPSSKLVAKVNRGRTATDADLKELVPLKNLTRLHLFQVEVTDVGLKELRQLKNLTELELSVNKVTDEGLKELGQLKNLNSLVLMQTEVTDAGLKELKELKNL
ncbi:MAG TPA: hypothetical protein VG122_25620, partial [Gemmata sp.]|nr:hypothetical protein [Gemmata sp.]